MNIHRIMLVVLAIGIAAITPGLKAAPDREKVVKINDGPYVFFKEKQYDAFWVCDGEVIKNTYVSTAAPTVFNRCNMPAVIYGMETPETKILSYAGDFPVAALSDFHGQYDLMITLLQNNRVIDENKQWSFGNGHFVITGDIFDRGDKVTEILWFLYDLERQAERVGGKVHLTLGNHEVMVLNGKLRYLASKYHAVSKKLNVDFESLFGKDTILGSWLRSKPVLVKINNMLFAHGGFHPSLAEKNYSLQEINRVFKDNLVESELPNKRKGFAKFLHRRDGPIWYRGYFAKERNKDNGATAQEIEFLLNHFKVKHLIVGHTSQDKIETRFGGKVIAIDSSIKRGKYGEILFVDNGKMWRGTLSGDKLPL